MSPLTKQKTYINTLIGRARDHIKTYGQPPYRRQTQKANELLDEMADELERYSQFEEIFRSKMTDEEYRLLNNKKEFAKWLDKNKELSGKCDEYAEKEKQGKLLTLPCAFGDEEWMQSIPNLHTVKLTFIDGDLEPDTGEFIIKTPGSISSEKVRNKLCKSYDKLIEKLPEGPFAEAGSIPETLVKYVCNKNDWTMQRIDFDITLEIGP